MTPHSPSSDHDGPGLDLPAAIVSPGFGPARATARHGVVARILADRVSSTAQPARDLAAALARHRTPTGREILANVEQQRRTYLAALGIRLPKDPSA